jgi:hypothetical protein
METGIQTLSSAELDRISGGVDVVPITFNLPAQPAPIPPSTSTTQNLYGIGVQSGDVTFGVGTGNSGTVGATIKISF